MRAVQGTDLIYVAEISRLRFFVSRSVPDVESLLLQHGGALRRFADLIIVRLARCLAAH
jgi:hypothetical protein